MKAICKLFGKVLEKPHLQGKNENNTKTERENMFVLSSSLK
jgi:hypothetical protein